MINWLKRLFAMAPCDGCGIEGGDRYKRHEIVGNRLVPRLLCSSCNQAAFFYGTITPITYTDERRWER